MTLEESVNSMSPELIAESLENSRMCLNAVSEKEITTFTVIANSLRRKESAPKENIDHLSSMARELEGLASWRPRQLVYMRAIKLLGE